MYRFMNWIRKITQPFNPPFWDHLGEVQFEIRANIRFKINNDPWFFISLGSLECTKALLYIAHQRGGGEQL